MHTALCEYFSEYTSNVNVVVLHTATIKATLTSHYNIVRTEHKWCKDKLPLLFGATEARLTVSRANFKREVQPLMVKNYMLNVWGSRCAVFGHKQLE